MVAVVARPKILKDPEVQADLLRAFRAGVSIEFACDVAGINPDTFYESQRRIRDGRADDWEAEFAEQCYRARSRSHLEMIESIEAAGRDPREWKAHAWALSKMRRNDFGNDDAAAQSPESKSREQLFAEWQAQQDAMDATLPAPGANTK